MHSRFRPIQEILKQNNTIGYILTNHLPTDTSIKARDTIEAHLQLAVSSDPAPHAFALVIGGRVERTSGRDFVAPAVAGAVALVAVVDC